MIVASASKTLIFKDSNEGIAATHGAGVQCFDVSCTKISICLPEFFGSSKNV